MIFEAKVKVLKKYVWIQTWETGEKVLPAIKVLPEDRPSIGWKA
jgi:hypothetical protein